MSWVVVAAPLDRPQPSTGDRMRVLGRAASVKDALEVWAEREHGGGPPHALARIEGGRVVDLVDGRGRLCDARAAQWWDDGRSAVRGDRATGGVPVSFAVPPEVDRIEGGATSQRLMCSEWGCLLFGTPKTVQLDAKRKWRIDGTHEPDMVARAAGDPRLHGLVVVVEQWRRQKGGSGPSKQERAALVASRLDAWREVWP